MLKLIYRLPAVQRWMSRNCRVDSLTGLKNFRALDEEFESTKYFYLIDLDNFRSINKSYGHANGSLILSHFGKVLERKLPSGEVYRVGGDEFVILTKENLTIDFFDEISDQEVDIEGKQIKLRASWGGVRPRKRELKRCFQIAGKKMYQRKGNPLDLTVSK